MNNHHHPNSHASSRSGNLFAKFASLTGKLALAAGLLLGSTAITNQASAQFGSIDAKAGKLDEKLGVDRDSPSAAKIYFINVRGQLGRDFAPEPLEDMVEDMRKIQPDYVVLYIDTEWTNPRSGTTNDVFDVRMAQMSYNQLGKVRDMGTILFDKIRNDSTWTKKPKYITWVKNAVGPSAFLAFMGQQIFYTPDGLHGGIGYLDLLFANQGDLVVREKQRSLRLGEAIGIAVDGVDPSLPADELRAERERRSYIVRAMARMDYVLSYRLVGGVPEFFEDMTSGDLLTDDGSENENRRDTMEDALRWKGNDVLNLRADMAKTLRLSSGDASSIDDLAFNLGVQRAYRVYVDKPNQIMANWSRTVARQYNQLEKLLRDYREIEVNGETRAARNAQRGRQMNNLREQIGICKRFGHAFANQLAQEFGADPDTIISENEARITLIQQEIRLDRAP
jgi:hypothetical protein